MDPNVPAIGRDQSWTLRSHLIVFGLVLAAPILFSCGYLLFRASAVEQTRIEERLRNKAQQSADAIDRELVGIITALEVLTTSPTLKSGDYAAFYKQAKTVLDYHKIPVIVSDPTGHKLVDTRVPWGEPLPVTAGPSSEPRDWTTTQLHISQLLGGSQSKTPLIVVSTPLRYNGGVSAVVSMEVDPERFAEVMIQQNLPPDWLSAISDRNGVIVARSRLHKTFVGHSLPAGSVARIARDVGMASGADLEGRKARIAYTRSKIASWTVITLAPVAVLQTPLHQFWRQFAWLGASMLALTLLLALFFGRRLTEPLQALAIAAETGVHDATVAPLGSSVREANAIASALRQASSERAAAAAATAHLAAIVETSSDAILSVSLDGTIRSWNKGAEEIFGYSAEEAIGQSAFMLYPDNCLAEYRSLWQALRAKGTLHLETVRRRKDGRLINVSIRVSSMLEGPEYSAIIRDITEQKRTEQALARSNEELEARVVERTRELNEAMRSREEAQAALAQAQKLEALGRLTGGLAHDFNNLLQLMIGSLNLFMMRTTQADNHDLLEDALEAAKTAAGLTDRLMASASRKALVPAPIDLNERIGAMTGLLRRSMGPNIEVVTALAPKLWKAKVDPSELENAILNLAVNARDAMPKGGRLMIATENIVHDGNALSDGADVALGEHVKLTVTDNGVGMPADVAQRVYEPFFTTKEPGRGTGLGLATIHGFVKQSGGHMTIDSKLGAGTTVSLYFSRTNGNVSPTDSAAADHSTKRGNGETILVVEDAPDIRRLTRRSLETLGYKVVEAEDGPRALTLLATGAKVDLIFSDIRMPGGMSGYHLVRKVRELSPTARTLLTSGFTADFLQPHANGENVAYVLRKPYVPEQLANAIWSALRSEQFGAESQFSI